MSSEELNSSNLTVYRSPAVVAEYAEFDELSLAELWIFEKYLKPGSRLLDLGVGAGRTTPYLSARASKYVGLDYSKEMIAACRAKYPALEFCVADASDLSLFADASFDAVVFSFNGIDYLVPDHKRQQCLKEMHRVLAPGGVLIFSTHNPRALIVGWDWKWDLIRKRAGEIANTQGLNYALVVSFVTCGKLGAALYKVASQSIPRIFQRVATSMFWRGQGYNFDSSHGGLTTHFAIPRCVSREVSSFPFELRQILPEDYPRSAKAWRTRWYYYIFSKVSKCGQQFLNFFSQKK
jgi:ubiquinone/menaquinone biosynthesis C-methylase UbiE